MPKPLFKALFGLLILFASCQKNATEDLPIDPPPVDPPPGATDSTRLSRFVEIETGGSNDTLTKGTITYDASKRISTIKMFFSDDPGDSDESEYFYTGNDTLPYKIAKFWDGEVYDTIFLTYKNGKVIKDSIVSWEPYLGSYSLSYAESFTFEEAGTNRYYVRRKVYGESDLLNPWVNDSMYCTRTIVNGNTISGKDSIYNIETAALSVYGYQTNFDDKPNPLRVLALPYPIVNEFLLDSHTIFDFNNRNNKTSHSQTLSSNGGPSTNSSITYTYEYRSDGYPLSMAVNDGAGSSSKTLLYYTK